MLTGMRISDLLQLRLGDYKAKEIAYKPRKTRTTSGKTVQIPVDAVLRVAAARYEQYLKSKHPRVNWTDKSLAFHSVKAGAPNPGRPMSRITVWQALQRWGSKYGIKDIGTHTLRRSFGYHAAKQGLPMWFIVSVLGHTSEAMTRQYCGLAQQDINEYYAVYGRRMRAK